MSAHAIRDEWFTHGWTTDKVHCLDLQKTASLKVPDDGVIVELGSYLGVSTLLLAQPWEHAKQRPTILSVDLCDAVSTETRQRFWQANGIDWIESLDVSSGEFLRDYVRNTFASDPFVPGYDMIFHDAQHGDHMVEEYLECWKRVNPGGVFAFHDADQVHHRFMELLKGMDRFTMDMSTDSRGRMLATFYKPE